MWFTALQLQVTEFTALYSYTRPTHIIQTIEDINTHTFLENHGFYKYISIFLVGIKNIQISFLYL